MIFVIGRCIKNKKHENLCFEAYSSVRAIYPNSKVLIVDDNSDFEDPNQYEYENTIFFRNEFGGSGELGLYYYFNKYCENKIIKESSNDFEGVIMHDSMQLRKEIPSSEEKVRFIWYFPNKIFDEKEEIMEIIDHLENKESLIKTYESPYWLGCFGVASIIKYSFLQSIVEKYNFFSMLNIVRARNYRCGLERVFSLICYTEIGFINSVCGNIFLHPRAFLEHEDSQSLKNLLIKYDAVFTKKWLGR